MAPTKVVIVHGGELARDVAERIAARASPSSSFDVSLRCASERPRTLPDLAEDAVVLCFVMQTVENESPAEEGGAATRFFNRRTHPADLMAGATYAVLGVGDSNLLLDRQTTSAKDCNQAARRLDARLEALGGTRACPLGMADERTGLTEVEPWIDGVFWRSLREQ